LLGETVPVREDTLMRKLILLMALIAALLFGSVGVVSGSFSDQPEAAAASTSVEEVAFSEPWWFHPHINLHPRIDCRYVRCVMA
jgi:hypothetical protein